MVMSSTGAQETRTAKKAATPPLSGWRIGISISESPDMRRLGFGDVHLVDAMVETARFLLANGAVIAYGGDLRPGGLTKALFEIVEAYNRSGRERYKRIENFLAWPLYLSHDLPMTVRATWKRSALFHEVPPPPDLRVPRRTFVAADSTENRYFRARSLTTMREEMNRYINARVLLGGKVTGFHGKYPGIAEEAYLALRDQIPLYPAGGFGGCTRAVVDALLGRRPEEFTDAVQLKNRDYAALVRAYGDRATAPTSSHGVVNYSGLVQFFREKGFEGLNNGLSKAENKRLSETIHVPEMIALVLKGLRTLDAKKA